MDQTEAKKKFQSATALYKEKRFEESLALIEVLTEVYPDNKELDYHRAACLASLDRLDSAQDICSELAGHFSDGRLTKLRQRIDRKLRKAGEWSPLDLVSDEPVAVPHERARTQPFSARLAKNTFILLAAATVGVLSHLAIQNSATAEDTEQDKPAARASSPSPAATTPTSPTPRAQTAAPAAPRATPDPRQELINQLVARGDRAANQDRKNAHFAYEWALRYRKGDRGITRKLNQIGSEPGLTNAEVARLQAAITTLQEEDGRDWPAATRRMDETELRMLADRSLVGDLRSTLVPIPGGVQANMFLHEPTITMQRVRETYGMPSKQKRWEDTVVLTYGRLRLISDAEGERVATVLFPPS